MLQKIGMTLNRKRSNREKESNYYEMPDNNDNTVLS